MKKKKIEVNVNGIQYLREVPIHWTLLEFLRDSLWVSSLKEGCRDGKCGACTIIANGKTMKSCLVFACDIDGAEILTIEGIGKELKILQQSFLEAGFHCHNSSTPGFLLNTKALLMSNPQPSREAISRAFSLSSCQLVDHESLFRAVEIAADKMASMLEKNREVY